MMVWSARRSGAEGKGYLSSGAVKETIGGNVMDMMAYTLLRCSCASYSAWLLTGITQSCPQLVYLVNGVLVDSRYDCFLVGSAGMPDGCV